MRVTFSYRFLLFFSCKLECAPLFCAHVVKFTLPMQILFDATPAHVAKLNAVQLVAVFSCARSFGYASKSTAFLFAFVSIFISISVGVFSLPSF